MPDRDLYELAERVGRALEECGVMIATAESCTGGWIAEAITMVPGSSSWFDRGFVTYTNRAKREMLGVRRETLERDGAVSEAVVREMVEGALARSAAQIAVAVSGIAGPSGGSPQKPVGMVCLAWGSEGREARAQTRHFAGDREAVRRQSVVQALQGVLELVAAGAASTSSARERTR